MGVHQHEAKTRSDRLIQAMDRLSAILEKVEAREAAKDAQLEALRRQASQQSIGGFQYGDGRFQNKLNVMGG